MCFFWMSHLFWISNDIWILFGERIEFPYLLWQYLTNNDLIYERYPIKNWESSFSSPINFDCIWKYIDDFFCIFTDWLYTNVKGPNEAPIFHCNFANTQKVIRLFGRKHNKRFSIKNLQLAKTHVILVFATPFFMCFNSPTPL